MARKIAPPKPEVQKLMDLGMSRAVAEEVAKLDPNVIRQAASEKEVADFASNIPLVEKKEAWAKAEKKKIDNQLSEFKKAHPTGKRSYGSGGTKNPDNTPEGEVRRSEGFLTGSWKLKVATLKWKGTEAETIMMLRDEFHKLKKSEDPSWANAPDPSKPYKLSEDKFSRYYGPKHTYLTSGAPVNPKG